MIKQLSLMEKSNGRYHFVDMPKFPSHTLFDGLKHCEKPPRLLRFFHSYFDRAEFSTFAMVSGIILSNIFSNVGVINPIYLVPTAFLFDVAVKSLARSYKYPSKYSIFFSIDKLLGGKDYHYYLFSRKYPYYKLNDENKLPFAHSVYMTLYSLSAYIDKLYTYGYADKINFVISVSSSVALWAFFYYMSLKSRSSESKDDKSYVNFLQDYLRNELNNIARSNWRGGQSGGQSADVLFNVNIDEDKKKISILVDGSDGAEVVDRVKRMLSYVDMVSNIGDLEDTALFYDFSPELITFFKNAKDLGYEIDVDLNDNKDQVVSDESHLYEKPKRSVFKAALNYILKHIRDKSKALLDDIRHMSKPLISDIVDKFSNVVFLSTFPFVLYHMFNYHHSTSAYVFFGINSFSLLFRTALRYYLLKDNDGISFRDYPKKIAEDVLNELKLKRNLEFVDKVFNPMEDDINLNVILNSSESEVNAFMYKDVDLFILNGLMVSLSLMYAYESHLPSIQPFIPLAMYGFTAFYSSLSYINFRRKIKSELSKLLVDELFKSNIKD